MINLGPFIPLIILIFIAVLILLGVRWFSNWSVARRGPWILGGYGVILLISVILYYFIPVSTEETRGVEHPGHMETFSNVISGEESVASMEGYLMEEWQFPYEEETLRIESIGDNSRNIRIAVEFTADDMIEAGYYRTPLYFDGSELESDLIPVDLQLESDRLDVRAQETTEEINVSSFSKEFPMTQFDEDDNDSVGFSFGLEIGWSEQLLYLQIPEDIEISTGSSVHLDYVN
ncbi:hypothetical protein [Virgibacillus kimchii]